MISQQWIILKLFRYTNKTYIYIYAPHTTKAVAKKIYVSFYIHSSHDQYVITFIYRFMI